MGLENKITHSFDLHILLCQNDDEEGKPLFQEDIVDFKCASEEKEDLSSEILSHNVSFGRKMK